MQNIKKFILCSHSRSGSTLLMSLLESHPDVKVKYEIFRDGLLKTSITRDLLERLGPIEYMQHCVFENLPPETKAAGFKLFYYHASEYPEFWKHLEQETGYHIVQLKRNNLLEVAASRTLMKQTQKSQKYDDIPEPLTRIDLTITECETMFHSIRRFEENFEKRFENHPRFVIYYEDIFQKLPDILEFLSLPKQHLTTQLKKQNRFKVSEVIKNYGELKAHFEGTKWKAFFEEL